MQEFCKGKILKKIANRSNTRKIVIQIETLSNASESKVDSVAGRNSINRI